MYVYKCQVCFYNKTHVKIKTEVFYCSKTSIHRRLKWCVGTIWTCTNLFSGKELFIFQRFHAEFTLLWAASTWFELQATTKPYIFDSFDKLVHHWSGVMRCWCHSEPLLTFCYCREVNLLYVDVVLCHQLIWKVCTESRVSNLRKKIMKINKLNI